MLSVIICSRRDKPPISLNFLRAYLEDNRINYHVAYDKANPFEGYVEGVKSLCLEDGEEQIVLCHDDIEILSTAETLKFWVDKYLNIKNAGFVGVAGSKVFCVDGAWWELRRRQEGMHRGFVFQGNTQLEMTPNYFGPFGEKVCVLDGCFLATKLKTLKRFGWSQPKYLTGFDFYDIHMTTAAFFKGLDNYVIPVIIKHQSSGEMRPTWYTSKDAYVKEHRQNIPFGCK